MMKPLFPAVLILTAALFTGCSRNEQSILPAETEITTTAEPVTEAQTTPAATETTAAVTTGTTTRTTAQTFSSQTVATTAESVTTTHTTTVKTTTAAVSSTAQTSETVVYENAITLPVSAFARRVPEKYREVKNLPKKTKEALENGTEITGKIGDCWIDPEADTIWLCIYYGYHYGFGGEDLSIRKGYSFYRVCISTGEITKLADDDDSPLRNLHVMMPMDGRLLVTSYHGFYYVDEEAGEIVTVDLYNEPLGGSTDVGGGKLYLLSHDRMDDGSETTHYRLYDPAKNKLTELTWEEYSAAETESNFFVYAWNHRIACSTAMEENEDGETVYRIEW